MKIIIVSTTFWPNVGGLENIMGGLAEEWSLMGNEVIVFTNVTSNQQDDYSFKVVRGISNKALNNAVKQADIFIEANLSLKTAIVGLKNRDKWIVSHHLPYQHDKGLLKYPKLLLTKLCHNTSCSGYIASTLWGKGVVINNFCDPLFKRDESIAKTKQAVFAGRLVSDKGVDVLLHAIALLSNKGIAINVTIIGDGPEKQNLVALTEKLALQSNVTFTGVLKAQALVTELNNHQLMVIPSLWNEPFGVVALEGMACGCYIIASKNGGLAEATGGFGTLVQNGDVNALALAIEKYFTGKEKMNETEVKKYLATKTRKSIAKQYLDYFLTIKSENN